MEAMMVNVFWRKKIQEMEDKWGTDAHISGT
jgi:hypothetical protein